jgi:hypothetical protein
MDVVTGGRNCPVNFNKHTLQLNLAITTSQGRETKQMKLGESALVASFQ